MTMKATEKIIEALTQLMEGFTELQRVIENDYGSAYQEDDDVEDVDTFEAGDEDAEAETALTKEIRAAVEAVIETEDFAPEEFAALITSMTDALEEIDPNIFDEGISTEEEEEGYVASDEDDDDEDYDEDDLDDEDLYDDEDYELDD